MAIVGTPTKKNEHQHTLSDNSITEVEVWQVLTDGSSSLREIRDASGLPIYGAPQTSGSTLYVASKRVRSYNGSPTLYEVEVEYRGDLYGPAWPDDPGSIIGLTRDTDSEWGTVETVEQVDQDVDGKKLQNVMKEDFDPPVTAMRSYTSLTVSRNELVSEWSISKAEAFRNTVNSAPFRGAPPKSCLCKSINAKVAKLNEFVYWRVTYQFLFKTEYKPADWGYSAPWAVRIANVGTLTPGYVGEKMGRVPITINGERPSKPIPLTLDGIPTFQVDGAQDTYWLGFQIYPEADFSALGLE